MGSPNPECPAHTRARRVLQEVLSNFPHCLFCDSESRCPLQPFAQTGCPEPLVMLKSLAAALQNQTPACQPSEPHSGHENASKESSHSQSWA
eukprot:3798510-Amphidinium_carterae.1